MSNNVELSDPPGVAPGMTYRHVARAGDFVFVAGQIAKDEHGNWVRGDITEQARQVYKNLDRVLAHVGATKKNVVKVNTTLVEWSEKEAVTNVRLDYFGDHLPPHTGVIVKQLGWPEIRLEVEVIIYLPQKKDGK